MDLRSGEKDEGCQGGNWNQKVCIANTLRQHRAMKITRLRRVNDPDRYEQEIQGRDKSIRGCVGPSKSTFIRSAGLKRAFLWK